MVNTFDWVEIRIRDIEEAVNFYKKLFGWEIIQKKIAEGTDYWIFDTGSTPRIENIQRGAMWLRSDGETLGMVVYILVDDVEKILKKVKELGGKIILPKTQVDSAAKAYFNDPSGNMFGLWEEKKAS